MTAPRGIEMLEKEKDHQGKPGDCEKVRGQGLQREKISREEKADSPGAGRRPGRLEMPQEQIRRGPGEKVMKYDEPVPGEIEWQEKVKEVGRIERARLKRGQQWDARIVVGIPERERERLGEFYPEEPGRDKVDTEISLDEDEPSGEDGTKVDEHGHEKEQVRQNGSGTREGARPCPFRFLFPEHCRGLFSQLPMVPPDQVKSYTPFLSISIAGRHDVRAIGH
jgi:hypothetical protein